MSAKLILRTTTGDNYDITFKLGKKVAELLQCIVDKYKFSPNTRIIFKDTCLNTAPNKCLQDFGIEHPAELLVTNHKHKTVMQELKSQAIDPTSVKAESISLYGKTVKISPCKLKINEHMIAHVTDAKYPLKRVRSRIIRTLDFTAAMREESMIFRGQLVDQEKVQQLIEMGFTKESAE
eukprot:TRINITY_DN5439_c0_g1_i5.p1 TRINITY_DN5439_c0_g1~~TRINITY_DN5439_c0_g1_i5.p1  ORF type:complete len:179 (-),score=41.69 TRINITY_DN5439_c0_g1_i5:300-836(-)